MTYKFFDTLLDSGKGIRRKRKLTLPVSIGIHAVVLGAVVVVPLLSFNDLPDPVMNGAIRAFMVEAAAPPPPPPPPPPAAAAPRPMTQPKIVQPKPMEEPKFTAPIEVPKELPKPEPDTGLGSGVPEPGEPGGVEGGVKGGTPGGVVGGVIGGVPGGVLGGIIGGVEKEEPPKPTGPVRVGGKIHPPAKINNVAPVYPPMARQARVEGVVILEATISSSGKVTDVKVLRGIPLLDSAALDAVRQWTYSPTLLNGVPVPVIMTVTVNFRLGSDSGGGSSARESKPAAPAAPTPAPAAAPAAPEPSPTPPPPQQ